MSDIAVRVEKLSKRYKIGVAKQRHDTLRDQLADGIRGLFRRNGFRSADGGQPPSVKDHGDAIWALKDVSFEVRQGEVLGIIGRNGAGKSTLLKILSCITEPTEGRAEVHGQVGSLLEVGTGFHPELTGRENIYLNGAILGMKKAEIERKFDEIVTFAEVEKFIDTPVKRYSSGMYVRLAFAVAAHLQPEILIVDEVLAVGDAAFQKKCLGKMDDVVKEGRTVLFVSHNTAAIKSLCSRALLLNAGSLAGEGNVDRVVDAYYAMVMDTEMPKTGLIPETIPRPWNTPEARLRSVRITDSSGKAISQLYFGQPFRITLTFDVLTGIRDAIIEVGISTLDGTRVTYSSNIDGEKPPAHFPRGRHTVSVDMDLILLPRQYTLDLGIHHRDGATIDWVERTLDFTVLNVSETGGDHYPWPPPYVRGFVRPIARWYVHEAAQSLPAGGARMLNH